ncbi:NAD(P)H-dependent oxidoreductase [Parapedobacter sp. ISTM3]|uniref:NADPH-dependent FMN reductase n=1 Tax=Parapedobacter sp. ISTM3 TaxID=2800130 RepID=UPI0019055DA6|nr:NAD(P)H-dependent oxidoreductase [Parapedobacter sp. ISTM3]MBK1439259.1 NAD(P)H-dependent oxidoreductase [Parapedobacter sp. ISTM3]
MKIVILAGSVRKNRKSINVCLYLENQFSNLGIEVDVIDMTENPLPIYDGFAEENSDVMKIAEKISVRLENADAMILVTPEYNGSFSGVLKNTLDYFWVEFARKPIGIAAVSAGRMGGINASTQLQHVILSLGAYPLPIKLLVPDVENTFDSNLSPIKDDFINNTNEFIKELLWFANALAKAKTEDVKEMVIT